MCCLYSVNYAPSTCSSNCINQNYLVSQDVGYFNWLLNNENGKAFFCGAKVEEADFFLVAELTPEKKKIYIAFKK